MEKKTKKESKTRTSITIAPVVLEALRKHCEEAHVSASSFIEEAVAMALGLTPESTTQAAVATEVPA